jgi:hypothetical protein
MDDEVALYVRFFQPMELAAPAVHRSKAGVSRKFMMTARAVWLQAEQPGHRMSSTVDAPRVLGELPQTGFRSDWDRFLLKRMTRVLSRRLGTS